MDLIDETLKAAIRNISKKLKETTTKEAKEDVMIQLHQIEHINRDRNYTGNQMGILELQSIIIKMKKFPRETEQ